MTAEVTTPQLPQPPKDEVSKQRRIALMLLAMFIIVVGVITIFIAAKHSSKNRSVSSNKSPTSTAMVSITAAGFKPATLQVKPDTLVTWTNNDSTPHKLSAEPYPTHTSIPGFNSKIVLQKGETYSFVFKKAGTYNYDDYLNPYTMKGVVSVK